MFFYLSVPLSSGQWLQPKPKEEPKKQGFFQSPCHRVNGCNESTLTVSLPAKQLSVPLSSGQWLQPENYNAGLPGGSLSVPLSSGQWLQQG